MAEQAARKIQVKLIGSAREGTSTPLSRLHSHIERKADITSVFDETDARRLEHWAAAQEETLSLTDTETGITVNVIPHPVSFADLAMLYHMEATHFACVALKAAAVGGGSWQLLTSDEQNASFTRLFKKKIHVPPEIQRFFEEPNEKKTIAEIIRDGEVDFQTTGNAYIEVVRSITGKPKELFNVPSYTVFVIDKKATAELHNLTEEEVPDYCQFIRDKNDETKGSLSFYRTVGARSPTTFKGEPVSEIIHFKEYSPITEDYGLPAILAALNQLLILREALHYRLSLFQDEGIGPTVFIFEGAEALSPDDEYLLNHYIEEAIRKRKGKILAIPTAPDVKIHIERLSMISELGADMIRELLTPMRDEVLRVHRVPPRLVSVADTKGLGGSAEALAQMEQFQAMVIDARQQMWANAINKHILRNGFAREDILFKITPISLRSLLDLQKYYLGWLDRGVLNIDDVRQMALGLDPLPDGKGEEYRILSGGQPIVLEKPGPKPGETIPGMNSENSDETP